MTIVWTASGGLLCALAIAPGALAGGYRFEQTGVRGGFSATSITDGFYQVEAFTRIEAPLRLELGRDWRIRTGVDGSGGMLARGGEQGLIGTIGPVLSFGRERFPVEIVGGTAATLLSRKAFDSVSFGIPFQFTSHIGLSLRLTEHLAAGYRFQHMSNASLSPHNPGLDLHSFSLGYRF